MGARARRRWKRFMKRVDDLLCSWGRCANCRVYDTPEGIGGKCVNCGKVHGWVTRDELRAYAEREARDAALLQKADSKAPVEREREPTPAEAAKIAPMGGRYECMTCGADVRGCMC